MSVHDEVVRLAAEFKRSPRNKIHLPERLLIESIKEETGEVISEDEFRSLISDYINGELDESKESLYDGAVYVCGLSARHCFGDDPEDDYDFQIDWNEQDDGSFIAEIRPS